MNRALEGSILKLNIQRAFFLTFLSKIVAHAFVEPEMYFRSKYILSPSKFLYMTTKGQTNHNTVLPGFFTFLLSSSLTLRNPLFFTEFQDSLR